MTQNKAQRATKAREATPQATSEIALLERILAVLERIDAKLDGLDKLDESIARGVRWAIGGRVNGPDNTKS
jgi:hypothetical protein